ncbi:putative beta-D-xylosidase 2 [Apostasia shenzhenica]|uniref:Putative beta-D-xylosidase 2 n=1 Tax=Apostasia shenzhenica TaxID=1088818 RepID=A0A2I0B195_9ASPA|nr:putative beta-D-xylosidase 2 [Apostasia shenzhenica]
MTLPEKIGQLGDKAVGVPRIGLPKYNWWSEALHGVSFVGHATYFGDIVPGATSFPMVITSAAAFNQSLWNHMGQVVSTEARAMYNLGHAGLTFWSPNINVVRDPRWGRILETPGEDPLTVGLYAKEYVRGLQDPNSRLLKVSSCCKHYAAYDLDNWIGVDRYHFDARVTEQDMVETFVRPFEMCVKEGDVSSIMCSYNRVNGIPACADPKLLAQTIRGDWDLHGYIVSDCDSLEVMHHGHKWLNDEPEDTVAQTLNAGLDLDCGIYYTKYTGSAVAQGKVRESSIDNALKNLYMVLMRLGFFDGSDAYESLGAGDICSPVNLELAAEAARQGIVLLKNNNTLPLKSQQIKKIALVGPHANATDVMIGNYQGTPCRLISPLQAFSGEVNQVDYQLGCNVACKNESLIFAAVKAAKKADATIIFAGIDLSVEAEGMDRTDLLLPGYQTQLINQVAQEAKGPVVLVILSAGGIDISFAKGNPNVGAIVWAGYPGAEGGRAITDVIFGRYNPGGRLPITWYSADYIENLPMTSMKLRPDDEVGFPGRTYKFYNGTTVFPFGAGKSYTTFNYTARPSANWVNIMLRPSQYCQPLNYTEGAFVPPCPSMVVDRLPCTESVTVEVEVANTGEVDGSHVVMVYSKPPSEVIGAPAKQLVDFQRVFVPAGKTAAVRFELNVCKAFAIVEKTAYTVLPAGQNLVFIGDDAYGVSFPVQINLLC